VLTALNLNGFFDVARFRAAKPNPQGLRTAVRALGLEPDRTIYYVGDRSSDAEAANAAGLLFAWASYGYDPVRPAHTAAVIGSFADVLEL
jgi:phosphoglycolate phosphatase-like HAD superfamily hydrolase